MKSLESRRGKTRRSSGLKVASSILLSSGIFAGALSTQNAEAQTPSTVKRYNPQVVIRCMLSAIGSFERGKELPVTLVSEHGKIDPNLVHEQVAVSSSEYINYLGQKISCAGKVIRTVRVGELVYVKSAGGLENNTPQSPDLITGGPAPQIVDTMQGNAIINRIESRTKPLSLTCHSGSMLVRQEVIIEANAVGNIKNNLSSIHASPYTHISC
jgi:hypothetical protein